MVRVGGGWTELSKWVDDVLSWDHRKNSLNELEASSADD